MRRYIKFIIVAALFINVGCNDWLDLKPANQATEEELYSTGYGFRTALNGLYHKMSSTDLYGKHLSFAFVDVLSQQYDINSENMKSPIYLDLKDYKYDSRYVVPVIEDIWSKAYNIIANANNIIAQIDTKSDELFERGEYERKMIKGEALACRALMHFDMLRLFAPSLVNDDNGAYIPYVDTYPTLRPNAVPVRECLNSIIEDLKMARELTISFDTTEIGLSTLCTGGARFLGEYETSTYLGESNTNDKRVNVFFKNRGYRLHYYAVTALLARAYQYADMHEEALECAEDVINAEWKKGKYFQFNTFGIEDVQGITTWNEIIEMWDQKTNLRLFDNLIFGCYNDKLHYSDNGVIYHFLKILSSGADPDYFIINKERQGLFVNSKNLNEEDVDVRSRYLLFNANVGDATISGKWYYSDNDQIRSNNFNTIPVIRLTEMYYIAAESYARAKDFDKAKELLEQVRSERGCIGDIEELLSWEEFLRELINDARREWISEGQLFYLYKRLDASVDFADGNPARPLKREEAIVPVPANQSL